MAIAITAPVSAEQCSVVGAGQATDDATVVLCSIHFQSQERAALITGYIEGDGVPVLSVRAIAAVKPDDGVSPDAGQLKLTGDPGLQVDVTDNNRVDLVVTGPAGLGTVNWRGYLHIAFVYDYEA